MTANDSMIVAVNWISRIFVHLDNFCHDDRMSKGSSLSPGYFMTPDFPLDSTYKLRPWFIEIWNTKLVHKLRHVSNKFLDDEKRAHHNQSGCKSSLSEGVEDPIKFIIRTWPWKEDVEAFSLPQVLIPVFHRGTNASDSSLDANHTTVSDTNTEGSNDNKGEANYGRIMDSNNLSESALMNTSAKNGTEDDPLVNIKLLKFVLIKLKVFKKAF